jgi:hypothetical protein
MDTNLVREFLTDTDHTGRFIVTSARTGKQYFVEAIGDSHIQWGSAVPGTETGFSTKKGWKKFQGSVEPEESLITSENGFTKIHELDKGVSPLAYIDMLDAQYPDKA